MFLEFPKAAFIDLEARFLQRVSQRPVAFLACLVRGRAESFHHVSQLSQVRHLGHMVTVRRFIPVPRGFSPLEPLQAEAQAKQKAPRER